MRISALAACILAVLLAPAAALAQGASYRLVGGSANSMIFFEEGSIRPQGATLTASQTIVFRTPYEDGNKFSSVRVEVNCAQRTFANLKVERFRANGQSIGSMDLAYVVKPLVAGSVMESFVEFVCGGAGPAADRTTYPMVSDPVAWTDDYYVNR